MEKANRYVEDIVVQDKGLEAGWKKVMFNLDNLIVGHVQVDNVQTAEVHLKLIDLIVS